MDQTNHPNAARASGITTRKDRHACYCVVSLPEMTILQIDLAVDLALRRFPQRQHLFFCGP